ncbi:transmembrane protein 200C-like isoform X2 [Leuresthes tenuis]|uniref:transmembrane protein 200C-like isoform X2 n=1 Tax=Leuresthes tenuis TaxID=355514 RepID=UPI003B5153FA
MIATGGLLRINARRQDSLRSKPHKAHKKKSKKKRRSEVVVVKGKLKLCSLSGLMAVLGVLVLLGGAFMAALGYWPRDGLFFSSQPAEPTRSPSPAQGGPRQEKLEAGANKGFNQTETINGTSRQLPQNLLEDFLDRYLYSDRLKVLGPLIMGIGIFLFICANAVLHENRDKKTKVINLRDIYSTVIDLHSLRKPDSSSSAARPSSANPINGLINYVQSKSLETKARVFPAALRTRAEAEGGAKRPGSSDAFFSVSQRRPDAPPGSASLPCCFSSAHSSRQKEALSSFTLPLRHPNLPTTRRRHSVWGGASGGGEELRSAGTRPPPPPSAEGGSQALLLLSSSSLSSLSHLLSSASSTPAPTCRRRSLPTASSTAGYRLLSHSEEEPSSQGGAERSEEVTSQRRCWGQLRMTSQEPGQPIEGGLSNPKHNAEVKGL